MDYREPYIVYADLTFTVRVCEEGDEVDEDRVLKALETAGKALPPDTEIVDLYEDWGTATDVIEFYVNIEQKTYDDYLLLNDDDIFVYYKCVDVLLHDLDYEIDYTERFAWA